jgi:methylmalonyl-CoA/ethylmalonyl-CoA epimerase
MQIDHIAIAVRSIDSAADRLCAMLGYARKTVAVTNTRQRVRVLFLSKVDSLDIKLIEPAADDSPLWDFVRKGGGLHHFCLRVADVPAACGALTEQGARVIATPQPGEAFDEHLIAFLYLGLGLNVEVVDTDSRRGLIAAETP